MNDKLKKNTSFHQHRAILCTIPSLMIVRWIIIVRIVWNWTCIHMKVHIHLCTRLVRHWLMIKFCICTFFHWWTNLHIYNTHAHFRRCEKDMNKSEIIWRRCMEASFNRNRENILHYLLNYSWWPIHWSFVSSLGTLECLWWYFRDQNRESDLFSFLKTHNILFVRSVYWMCTGSVNFTDTHTHTKCLTVYFVLSITLWPLQYGARVPARFIRLYGYTSFFKR